MAKNVVRDIGRTTYSMTIFIWLSMISDDYTHRQINQDRMIFGDFSVNSKPISFKLCKGHFLFKS